MEAVVGEGLGSGIGYDAGTGARVNGLREEGLPAV